MKFFTIEWHSGEMPEAESAQVPAAYAAHLDSLRPELPEDAFRLSTDVNLHDGVVQKLYVDAERIVLVIRGEDGRGEVFDASLAYGGWTISEGDLEYLKGAKGKGSMELLYNEFDRVEGRWVHRLLFWPYREVAVEFRGFGVEIRPTVT
jgi:hypothetical protein